MQPCIKAFKKLSDLDAHIDELKASIRALGAFDSTAPNVTDTDLCKLKKETGKAMLLASQLLESASEDQLISKNQDLKNLYTSLIERYSTELSEFSSFS